MHPATKGRPVPCGAIVSAHSTDSPVSCRHRAESRSEGDHRRRRFFSGAAFFERTRAPLVRRVQLLRARWTPFQRMKRHAVEARGDCSSHVPAGAVLLGKSSGPRVCDAGATGAHRAVAAAALLARGVTGGRWREIVGHFRWRLGERCERCGANWAWMSMRRRLITRTLINRVVSRRSVPRRTGPRCGPAWHAGWVGPVAGLGSRSPAVTTARAVTANAGPAVVPAISDQEGTP
jgi:hypothetical protein